MRGKQAIVMATLLLAACGGKEKAVTNQADAGGGPAIMTSIDDVALPVDRSAQITGIDAASGDSSGMPADGGAVVEIKKPELAVPPTPVVAAPAVAPAAPPLVTPAAPVAPAGGDVVMSPGGG